MAKKTVTVCDKCGEITLAINVVTIKWDNGTVTRGDLCPECVEWLADQTNFAKVTKRGTK